MMKIVHKVQLKIKKHNTCVKNCQYYYAILAYIVINWNMVPYYYYY